MNIIGKFLEFTLRVVVGVIVVPLHLMFAPLARRGNAVIALESYSFDSLFIKIIIYLGLRNRQKFLRMLAKLEYGVAIFCFKLAEQAATENRLELAALLAEHGAEENKHGKMLGAIADGRDHMIRVGTGRWVEIFRGEVPLNEHPQPSTIKPKTLEWDSTTFPGERLVGTLESFDGISYRYLSLKMLFRNRAAADYPWADKLAFMYALEEKTASFYQELMKDNDPPLRAIATQIAGDEFAHANYLKVAIADFTEFPQEVIREWCDRITQAKFGLIFDALRHL